MEEKQTKKKESQKQKANTKRKKKANRYITEKNHHD
jgi:hypothetical protein